MLTINIIATANPQDFYEGAEPEDLRICKALLPDQFDEAVNFAAHYCTEGYSVILTLDRGEPDG